jgi:hypothetical protein
MSIAAGLIVLACIMAVLIGSMMYLAQRDERVRERAEKLIAKAGHQKTHSAPLGEMVFRKPRLSGYLILLLFFWVFCIALYGLIYNWISLHTAARPVTGFSAGMVLLASLALLAMAVRQFRYSACVSDDELTITDLTTRSVPLRDIGEVTIGVSRASSFCQIRLITGEEGLMVASDLTNFPEFVSLLSERVKESKTRGDTGPSVGSPPALR